MATPNIPSCVLNQIQQFQQDFQQFGKDLQSGRISAAQSDLATLQKEVPQVSCPQTVQCDGQLAQASNQLAGANRGSGTTGQDNNSTLQQGYTVQISAGRRTVTPSSGGQANLVSPRHAESAASSPAGSSSHAQSDYASLQQIFEGAGGEAPPSGPTRVNLSILA